MVVYPLTCLHVCGNKDEIMYRRAFLQQLARSALGVSVLPLASTALSELVAADRQASAKLSGLSRLPRRPTARHVIWLTMAGGMSHLDTWDPKPEMPDYQGPVQAIESNVSGLRLSENLPLLASACSIVLC